MCWDCENLGKIRPPLALTLIEVNLRKISSGLTQTVLGCLSEATNIDIDQLPTERSERMLPVYSQYMQNGCDDAGTENPHPAGG